MKDIDRYIQIRSNNLKPAKGRLLLSEPFLGDFFFGRSVVLLTEHNAAGSFGLIMNKPANTTFNQLIRDMPSFDAPIYLGGPVETSSLFFVHTIGSKIEDTIQISKKLWWGGNFEQIKDLIGLNLLKTDEIRFFMGYSGWSANQLDEEIKKNSWVIVNPLNANLLLQDPLSLWEKTISMMGKNYSYWTKFPADPSTN